MFRFREAVVEIGRSAGRVTGVTLASGETVSAPVVVNVGGPHSGLLNEMAGVVDDMRIGHRPLRQEVFTVPAPTGFGLDDGGPIVADLDIGQYFRPQAGGTLLVGGTEAECDELEWIDDPDHFLEHPTVEIWETTMLRLARRLPEFGVPARPVGLAALYDAVRRLGADLRQVQPGRVLHGLRDQRQPVQERPHGRPVHARARRRGRRRHRSRHGAGERRRTEDGPPDRPRLLLAAA